MDMNLKKLILVGPNPYLCKAWEKAFKGVDHIAIENKPFEMLEQFDCMVSPANSFGLMDGGVDLAITHFFGLQLQQRVQQQIIDRYSGEQPVGTSMIVETGHPNHPYLAHTPTMRIPMSIQHTDHVYLAMKAMLLAVRDFNRMEARISTIACPGLGTATGRVAPEEAARQMALAYKNVLHPPEEMDWAFAVRRHREIVGGGG